MSIYRQALDHYSKGSNTYLIRLFVVVGLIAAGLTILYVYFVGQQHTGNFLLSYLMPLILLAGGIAFIIAARLVSDYYAKLAYAILAIFLLFSAVVSFVVTLILLVLVF